MRRQERGSGTLLVVAILGCLLMLGAGVGVLGGYAAAGHRARAAADLAALSGAAVRRAGGDVCAAAAEAAQRNGAAMVSCTVTGTARFVVAVAVSVAVTPSIPGLPAAVVARAYAGSASLAGGG